MATILFLIQFPTQLPPNQSLHLANTILHKLIFSVTHLNILFGTCHPIPSHPISTQQKQKRIDQFRRPVVSPVQRRSIFRAHLPSHIFRAVFNATFTHPVLSPARWSGVYLGHQAGDVTAHTEGCERAMGKSADQNRRRSRGRASVLSLVRRHKTVFYLKKFRMIDNPPSPHPDRRTFVLPNRKRPRHALRGKTTQEA